MLCPFYELYVLVLQIQTHKMILIFAIFFKLSFFDFFQLQGPGNVLCGLIIEHCIISSNNGLFLHLISRNSAFFDKICNFFKVS